MNHMLMAWIRSDFWSLKNDYCQDGTLDCRSDGVFSAHGRIIVIQYDESCPAVRPSHNADLNK